mgnify:CR=1 FL=1
MLTNEEITAIATFVSAEKQGDAKVGIPHDSTTEVDVTVRLRGTVAKAAKPAPRSATSSIPWLAVIAKLAKAEGAVENAILDTIFAIVHDVVSEDIKLKANTPLNAKQRRALNKERRKLIQEAGVAERIVRLQERSASALPKKEYEGRITVTIMAEVLSGALVDPAAVSEVVDEVIVADEVAT